MAAHILIGTHPLLPHSLSQNETNAETNTLLTSKNSTMSWPRTANSITENSSSLSSMT
jgi:hypothetical protein